MIEKRSICIDGVIFEVGKPVIAVRNIDERISEGSTGIIRCVTDDPHSWWQVGVEWDTGFEMAHNLDGHCAPGHGWYVYAKNVMPLCEEEELITEESSDGLLNFLGLGISDE